jgi:hypothetical protein
MDARLKGYVTSGGAAAGVWCRLSGSGIGARPPWASAAFKPVALTATDRTPAGRSRRCRSSLSALRTVHATEIFVIFGCRRRSDILHRWQNVQPCVDRSTPNGCGSGVGAGWRVPTISRLGRSRLAKVAGPAVPAWFGARRRPHWATLSLRQHRDKARQHREVVTTRSGHSASSVAYGELD